MQDNINNRMSSAKRRGRPTLAEIQARGAPAEPSVAAVANPDPTLPPLQGFVCPCCGRGQVPRIQTVRVLVRYVACSLCGGRIRVDYATSGAIVTIQRI